MPAPGYRKRTIFLLVSLLLIRFWFGQSFEITGPEAFLWLKSHGNIAPAYWEAGPLVPWLVRLGTLFFGDGELGVRWISAVIYCSAGFILFFLSRHWFGAKSAYWTVLLFVILPMYAWKLTFMTEATVSLGLMSLALLGYRGALEENKPQWWVLSGVVSGLALLVSGANVFWLVGLTLAFALTPEAKPRLTSPWFFGMAIGALLCFTPVVYWWSSNHIYNERMEHLFNVLPLTHNFSLNQGFHFIALELLYVGPLFLFLLEDVFFVHRLRKDSKLRLLFWLPVPGLIWQHLLAFFQEAKTDTLPALFFPWLILAGASLAVGRRKTSDLDDGATPIPQTQSPRLVAVVIGLTVLTAVESIIGLNPYYYFDGLALKPVPDGANAASVALDHRPVPWRDLAGEVQDLENADGASFVIADSPETASVLSFYLHNHPFVYLMNHNENLTQFDFWQQYSDTASPGDSFIFVSHSSDPPPVQLTASFESVSPASEGPVPPSLDGWYFWKCVSYHETTGNTHSNGPPRMPVEDPLPK